MRKWVLAVVLTLLGCVANAFENTPRTLPLGKHGALEISAPSAWLDSVAPPKNELPQSLKLVPKSGAPFEVYVAPFPPEAADGKYSPMDELRKATREAANSIAYKAVEKPIELKEIHGANNGYYFSVTDKAPKAGEFKFMTQGVLSVGQLRVIFVILSNDGQQNIVKEALAVVTAAAHR